mmetsp:Transcript_72761/g.184192  ORF Transcript_72761/g.184192 Transcript_72761/m.184192 type:complete len:247 (-) Transcript_72761:100-840(-)
MVVTPSTQRGGTVVLPGSCHANQTASSSCTAEICSVLPALTPRGSTNERHGLQWCRAAALPFEVPFGVQLLWLVPPPMSNSHHQATACAVPEAMAFGEAVATFGPKDGRSEKSIPAACHTSVRGRMAMSSPNRPNSLSIMGQGAPLISGKSAEAKATHSTTTARMPTERGTMMAFGTSSRACASRKIGRMLSPSNCESKSSKTHRSARSGKSTPTSKSLATLLTTRTRSASPFLATTRSASVAQAP